MQSLPMMRGVLDTTLCDKVGQRPVTCSRSQIFSTNKTEVFLKMVLNLTIFSTINFFKNVQFFLSILLRKENCIWSSHFAIVLLLIQKMYFS